MQPVNQLGVNVPKLQRLPQPFDFPWQGVQRKEPSASNVCGYHEATYTADK